MKYQIVNHSMESVFYSVLSDIQRATTDAHGVQIGAFDGVGFDETQPILKNLQFPFLFVEPIPYYFQRMRSNLGYTDKNRFDNCAVSTTNGTAEMAVFDPATYYENQPMSQQYCLTGMSSLFPIRNSPWQEGYQTQSVTTKRLDTLLVDNESDGFHVFLCDTEGYDYEVFKQINVGSFSTCDFWRFEIQHLPQAQAEHMIDIFKIMGYAVYAYHAQYEIYSDAWSDYRDHACQDLTAIRPALLSKFL